MSSLLKEFLSSFGTLAGSGDGNSAATAVIIADVRSTVAWGR